MITIIPTILAKTFEEFKESVKKIENEFPVAQIDVMDGKFVPNITFFNIDQIALIDTPIEYELHLMAENSLTYINESGVRNQELWKKVQKILFHFEAVKDPQSAACEIQNMGKKAFLVLNPETPLDAVDACANCLDGIMLMGVYPGKAGQKFLPQTIERVQALREKYPKIPIEVDGGVNDANALELVEAGATILAVHSFLYQGNVREQKKKFFKILEK